jgi:hypothetical protein
MDTGPEHVFLQRYINDQQYMKRHSISYQGTATAYPQLMPLLNHRTATAKKCWQECGQTRTSHAADMTWGSQFGKQSGSSSKVRHSDTM